MLRKLPIPFSRYSTWSFKDRLRLIHSVSNKNSQGKRTRFIVEVHLLREKRMLQVPEYFFSFPANKVTCYKEILFSCCWITFTCSEILRYIAEWKIESAWKYESIPSCSLLKHVWRTELDICCSGKYFDTTSGIRRTETWEDKEEGMINCMHTFIQNYNAGTWEWSLLYLSSSRYLPCRNPMSVSSRHSRLEACSSWILEKVFSQKLFHSVINLWRSKGGTWINDLQI